MKGAFLCRLNIKKKEQYQERFYQLPKVFFTNEIYKKLSLEAKVAYSILRDRLELSLSLIHI